jgi:peptide/nickel transport system ATP-binding protein
MDEPTTALDVVVQQEIMHQIKELQQQLGFSILFITHDISLMVELSHRMAVMYAGKLVEVAPSKDMLDKPLHPYTNALMGAFPPLTGPRVELTGIPDAPPNMAHPPTGCRFHPRCPLAIDACTTVEPPLLPKAENHDAACLLVPEYVVPRERSRR